MLRASEHPRQVFRVNFVTHPPSAQLVHRLAEVLADLVVDDFELTIDRHQRDSNWDAVCNRSGSELTRALCLFGLLAVFDVRQQEGSNESVRHWRP